jgi:hypothetical protein
MLSASIYIRRTIKKWVFVGCFFVFLATSGSVRIAALNLIKMEEI